VIVELEVTSWIFERGHRVRLDLAGADWPNCWPPPEPVTLGVDTARSAIELPVLEEPAPIRDRPDLPTPRRPQIAPAGDGDSGELEVSIERGRPDGTSRVAFRYGGPTEATDEGPELDQRYEGALGVSIADPGRAWVDASATFRITWPEAVVTSRTHSRIDSDAEAYDVRIEIDAMQDGETVRSLRFERRIPRNLQ
jgi:hypothetical protein